MKTPKNEVFFRPEEINRLLPELKSLGIFPENFMGINEANAEEAADYINGFFRNKIIPDMNPTTVYEYQALLGGSYCPTCQRELNWRLVVAPSSDKFMHATCCGLKHEMVPDQVRILTTPSGVVEDVISDPDFLKELQTFM